MSGDEIIYQTTVLNKDLVETLIVDDSPNVLWHKFWEFMGIDLPVAFIEPWDFENILDMVDIAFLNIIEQHPENNWDSVAILEKSRNITKDGQVIETLKHTYLIFPLWDSVRAKVYNKMCRARGGFTLRAITESRSKIEQNINDNSPRTPEMMQMQQANTQRSGWKP